VRLLARWLLLLAVPGLSMPALISATPDWAVAVFPSGAEFTLEIAADPETRQRGYMYREHVGSAEGMLFIFATSVRHGIWMKNCKVALDIVWLDEGLRVVDIAADFKPCPAEGECVARQPMADARYVLEVAAGRTTQEGLRRGDSIVVLSEPELP
jgi:uncharacterized membrane protein (UPF0127 family)